MLHVTCSALKNFILKARVKRKGIFELDYSWMQWCHLLAEKAQVWSSTATRQVGHSTQDAARLGAKEEAQLPSLRFVLNANHLGESSWYFQHLAITEDECGRWHYNVIGMLQKKVTKKGKQTQLRNTEILQACNAAKGRVAEHHVLFSAEK